MENKISINDPLFEPAIQSLEEVIQALLLTMQRKRTDTGVARLSITIEMKDTEAVDPENGEVVFVQTPQVNYRASYGISSSDNVKGSTRDERRAVQYDQKSGRIFIGEIQKPQQSMF